MNELALFAGGGGGILGGILLGWRTRCAVEVDPDARRVLLARQRDGSLHPFPIWDDIRTFDGKPWRGTIDVVSGGFPCQDVAAMGPGLGLSGSRSGLWRDMARTIGEVGPRYVFLENSPLLVSRGLADVVADLARMGFNAVWGVIGADDAGFPHHRKRLWLVGYSVGSGLERHPGNEQSQRGGQPGSDKWSGGLVRGEYGTEAGQGWQLRVDSENQGQAQDRPTTPAGLRRAGWKPIVHGAERDDEGNCPCCGRCFADCGCPGPTMEECQYGFFDGATYARPKLWHVEPGMGRVVNGLAGRVDRLRIIGNGQVPGVAALAWRTLFASIPQPGV